MVKNNLNIKPYSHIIVTRICDSCFKEDNMAMYKLSARRKACLKNTGEEKDYCQQCFAKFYWGNKKRPKEIGEKISASKKGKSYIRTGVKYNSGYKTIYQSPAEAKGKTKYKLEHRIIMEESIGRPLLKEEKVHHINGDKLDNRIENLLLCYNTSDHSLIHANLEQVAFDLIKKGIIEFDFNTRTYKIKND